MVDITAAKHSYHGPFSIDPAIRVLIDSHCNLRTVFLSIIWASSLNTSDTNGYRLSLYDGDTEIVNVTECQKNWAYSHTDYQIKFPLSGLRINTSLGLKFNIYVEDVTYPNPPGEVTASIFYQV
jgi:hypothetical protein